LVTGSNRGLGAAFVESLRARGAAKIYGGARSPKRLHDGVIPVQLDITDPDDVARAAQECFDVDLLINNAGVLRAAQPISDVGLDAARAEIETNYLGTLSMCRAFAPVLERNGGGALVNVLSAVSWFAPPVNGTYAASKAAAWLLTHSVRQQLRDQGTLVVAVHASFIDTDMAAHLAVAKVDPRSVADQTLDAVVEGRHEVLADARSRQIKSQLSDDLQLIYGLDEGRSGSALN
jgi:NAD(P)-dependent dehydrogenase (short-subunit alcohol dehydrogenase family)